MSTWCALVPQKSFARAKGRIALPAAERERLAVAMLRDTVAALAAAPRIAHTFVLWDDDRDRWALAETGSVHHVSAGRLDLNEALEVGAARARRAAPRCGVVVVPSDLPALQPVELGRFLDRSERHARAFLPDLETTGTSMLTAMAGSALLPSYGPGSRDLHVASGAHELSGDDLPGLRRDVDDLPTLARALELGCGSHTVAALLGIASGALELEPAG